MNHNAMRVLVIEDDEYIMNFVTIYLKDEGYEALQAATAAEGMRIFAEQNPNIILLDLGLPDLDGIDVITAIRQKSKTPIIVLSARAMEKEKIAALDAGADDYMTKPFHMGELLARIRVAQRKMDPSQPEGGIFTCEDLSVDYDKRLVTVAGNEIHLTPIEYRLLTLLIANRGRVLTHNFILNEVWGYDDPGDPGSLRVFMASLRRKIEKDTSHPRLILTQVGVGYRFVDTE